MKRLLAALMLALLVVPGVALAATGRASERVTVPAEETVDDDVYAAGSTVTISGTVNGDVVAVASTVTIDGTVTGSVWAAASEVRVNGTVGGSLRAAGSSVKVAGTVRGDALVAAGTLDIVRAATVARDVAAAAGTATIDGTVGRHLKISGGGVRLGGAVAGNVSATTRDPLELKPEARIAGTLNYTGPHEYQRDPNALVGGAVTYTDKKPDDENYAERLVDQTYWFLSSVLLLITILLYGRRAALRVRDAVLRRPGVAALLGLGFLIAVPLIALILLVVLVGIPLALFALAGYFLVIYSAKVFVALALGGILLRHAVDSDPKFFGSLAAGIIGLALYYLLTAVPVAGPIVMALTVLIGTGAQLLMIRRLYGDARAKYGS